MDGAAEDDDDEETEDALDEFQQGSPGGGDTSGELRRPEFSQQVKLYSQNKPRKAKKSTDSELVDRVFIMGRESGQVEFIECTWFCDDNNSVDFSMIGCWSCHTRLV